MIFGSKLAWGAILLVGAFFAGCQQDVNAPNKDKQDVKNHALSGGRCSDDSLPVCGKDGVSYRNACAASEVGKTEVASQGICSGHPLNGWVSDNFTAPPVDEDPRIIPIGGDTPIECGTPDSYDPNDLIDPVPANPLVGKCGDPFPDIAIKCASDLAPVCGCDGKTYRNGCYAMGVGHVWVKSEGACPGQPYVEE